MDTYDNLRFIFTYLVLGLSGMIFLLRRHVWRWGTNGNILDLACYCLTALFPSNLAWSRSARRAFLSRLMWALIATISYYIKEVDGQWARYTNTILCCIATPFVEWAEVNRLRGFFFRLCLLLMYFRFISFIFYVIYNIACSDICEVSLVSYY